MVFLLPSFPPHLLLKILLGGKVYHALLSLSTYLSTHLFHYGLVDPVDYNSLLSFCQLNCLRFSHLETFPSDLVFFLSTPISYCIVPYLFVFVPGLSYTFLIPALESAISLWKPDNFY